MAPGSLSRDADARLGFVAEPAALAALDLTVADLADADVRSLVIRHEHPEFDRALREGRREVEVDGEPINPRLHLAMHEIVATQLWDDDPPEVWTTAARLLDSGYDRHEVLHMLAAPVAQQVWGTLHAERPYDRDLHVAALQALPGRGSGNARPEPGRGVTPTRARTLAESLEPPGAAIVVPDSGRPGHQSMRPAVTRGFRA